MENRFEILEKINSKLRKHVIFSNKKSIVAHGDSLELLKKIPDHSISLILTDPPYHTTKKKNIAGDTDFSTNKEYVEWMSRFAVEWRRVIKNNGSILCFCSSAAQAELEIMFSRYFNILTSIVWTKPNEPGFDGWKQKAKKESLRHYYQHSERAIFMEPAEHGNLKRSTFGSLLKRLRKSANLSTIELAEIIGAYGKVNHGGAVANWEAGRNVPSKEQYEQIKKALREHNCSEMIPDYEDAVRPFNVTKDDCFTDVWDYPNVRPYKGKHPAEKPFQMLSDIIRETTFENDIVLDCFSGSGSTGVAALSNNRLCVLIDIDEHWAKYSANSVNTIIL